MATAVRRCYVSNSLSPLLMKCLAGLSHLSLLIYSCLKLLFHIMRKTDCSQSSLMDGLYVNDTLLKLQVVEAVRE